jgi:hypothetical protein
MTRPTATLLLLAAVTAGCYGTPKGTHSGKAGSGGAGAAEDSQARAPARPVAADKQEGAAVRPGRREQVLASAAQAATAAPLVNPERQEAEAVEAPSRVRHSSAARAW